MQQIIIYALVSFTIAFIVAPFAIRLLRRLKAGQEILHYVDFHAQKKGTPTMGGIIFILPLVILAPIFVRISTPFSLVVLLSALGYAWLGFLDDYIKVRTKNNLGLRAYQKIIGQGGIALLVAIFYFLANPEGRMLLPFFNIYFDIGWGILPLTFIVLVATTNSVNLTDGIDGLASWVSLLFLVFFMTIAVQVSGISNLPELQEFMKLSAIIVGGLLAFLIFNTNKASVFMGDTGSLFLGGIIATLAVFSFMSLFIIFLGAMFVVSAASVIIQVLYFKKTGGKRVFLMTPYHHHLEKKGLTEAKIVFIYGAVTVLMGSVLLLSFL